MGNVSEVTSLRTRTPVAGALNIKTRGAGLSQLSV